MAVTTTQASKFMLERVDPKIQQTFEQEDVLLSLLMDGAKREKVNTRDGGTRVVAYVQPNASFGSLAEAAYLPLPGTPVDVEMRIPFTRQWKTGSVSGDVLDLDDDNVIAGLLKTFTGRDTDIFKKEINQQLYSDGSGKKGVVSSFVTGAAGTVTFGGALGSRQILIGARLQFFVTDGTAHDNGLSDTASVVTANNVTTGVVTFDYVPTDIAANDIAVYENSFGKALTGLEAIVSDDTGNFQSVSRGTYPSLKATVYDADGDPLTVGMMDTLLAQIQTVGGVNAPQDDFVIIMHPAQAHAYRSLGSTLTRTVNSDGSNKLDLGFPMIGYNGMRIRLDLDCPRNRIYFLRLSGLRRYIVRDPGLYKRGGTGENGVLHMKPGTATYADDWLYFINMKGNIGSPNPNVHGVIDNLAIPAGL